MMTHKIQVTENISVVLFFQRIEVIVKDIPFNINIWYEKNEDEEVGDLIDKKELEPIYHMHYKAEAKYTPSFFSKTDIKVYKKEISEIAQLFDFALNNQKNWFDMIKMEGELCGF